MNRRRFLSITAVGVAGVGASRRAASASGLTLGDIKGAGKLRIGVEAAYVPFTFRKEGQIVGYDVDFAEVFCKTLGVKPEFIDTAWAGVIPSLYAKKFDIVMSAMTYTAERIQRVAFTIPYGEASQALLVRAGDAGSIQKLDDLSKKAVGIKLGSPGEILAKKQSDDLALVLRDAPGKYAMVKGLGADNWCGIACRKEDTEVVEFLNEQIRKLRADETLGKLQEKWFGFRMNLADKVPAL